MQVSMTMADAQRDMRYAYSDGAPGMLVSALVWAVAGTVAFVDSPSRAIWALFIGGMLIHPLGVVVNKLLGRPGAHASNNPLAGLALEGTVWMLLCMVLAYVVSLYRLEWFFPAMLFVIGGRYLTFATLYGSRLYWLCGAALAAAGYMLVTVKATPALSAWAGAGIEAVFAVVIFVTLRRQARGQAQLAR